MSKKQSLLSGFVFLLLALGINPGSRPVSQYTAMASSNGPVEATQADYNLWLPVVFEQNIYTVTTTTVGNGSISRNNPEPYHYGDVVQLTATPVTGWRFSNWTGDITGSTNPVSITINGNKNVTAHFTQNEYTLTVTTVGNGSVSRNNSGPYHYGDVVQLTATPATGWGFSNWTGDITRQHEPGFDHDQWEQERYRALYTERVHAGGHDVGQWQCKSQQLRAVSWRRCPANCRACYGVELCQLDRRYHGSANPISITINGNKSVTAHFTQNVYTLTITPVGSGSVSRNNPGPYHYGDVVQLTAVPNGSWSFHSWTGDLTGSANPASITINGNKSVTAQFTEYTLTVTTWP